MSNGGGRGNKRRRERQAWMDILVIGGCALLVWASIREGLLGAAWSAAALGLFAVLGYVLGEVNHAREARHDQSSVDDPDGTGGGAGKR